MTFLQTSQLYFKHRNSISNLQKARYYFLILMRKGDVLFMNMHQKQELSLFAEELYRYMSPASLNQLAIEAGSMKRKRKCQGIIFYLCVYG